MTLAVTRYRRLTIYLCPSNNILYVSTTVDRSKAIYEYAVMVCYDNDKEVECFRRLNVSNAASPSLLPAGY